MGSRLTDIKERGLDKQGVRTTIVVAEPDLPAGSDITKQVIAAAQKLGSFFEHRLITLLPYPSQKTTALDLANLGPVTIYQLDEPPINAYPQEVVLWGLIQLHEEFDLDMILFSASEWGTEMAARTASRLRVGLLHDLIDIESDGNKLVGVHMGFQDGLICRTSFEGPGPWIATTKPGAFCPCNETGRIGHVEDLTLKLDPALFKISMTRRLPPPAAGMPSLEKAEVVVAGGQGVGSKEGFAMLEELANLLGGCVGCTLPPVENGWTEREFMIGSTGKTIHPKMYIGCGISGDVYHTSGMDDSEHIVVINNDEKAPLFDMADCGIMGDLHEIVPCIIERLQGKLKK